MNEGLVSVIIPCYNGEEYLGQALKSVQWQTYKHWECILVDDGSTDRSASVFNSFAGTDARFRYHRKENGGLAAARNSGITLARGEFIQFLDDDDVLLENRLTQCAEQFRLHPEAGIVYSDYVCFKEGEGFYRSLPARIPEGDIFLAFLCDQNRLFAIPVHSYCFRRSIVENNLFDTSLGSYAEDVECWTRIAERGARFQYLDEVHVIYRFTTDSLIQDDAKLLQAKVNVLKRYADHPKVRQHQERYRAAMNYFQEHYIIGCFMKKDFAGGMKGLRVQFPSSRWKGKLKMLVWFALLTVFSKQRVAKARAWIVNNTPFKWGGWKHYRTWTPPESVCTLIVS